MVGEEFQRLLYAARQLIEGDRRLAGDVLAPGAVLPPAPAAPMPTPPAPTPRTASPGQEGPHLPPRPGPPARPAPSSAPAPAATWQQATSGPVKIPPPDDSKWANDPEARRRQAELDKIAEEIARCRKCPLGASRGRAVPGEGSPMAEVVFIGEAPGEEEDRQGRPFVGRAGELLTKMISAMGLTRSDVYIANILKCRPPGNRAPLADEVAACADYLRRQLLVIRPKVIVALGNPAMHALLDTTEGISRMRGRWFRLPTLDPELAEIKVMPTFHPAYLLRAYTEDNRKKVWSDVQEVMKELALPTPKRAKGL